MFCAQVEAVSVDAVKASIVKHSMEMGVDPAITLSIAKTESGYRHDTRSPRGAVGVFQLMPSTARRMGLNPYSLDDNDKGGVMYYKSMYQMFGSMQLAIAAYNAGPGTVKRYHAIPPYKETRRYVAKIMADYHYLKAHTDPAVVAYNKSKQQVKAVSDIRKNVGEVSVANDGKENVSAAVKTSAPVPEQVQTPKIMASMPVKTAPLPTVGSDHSKKQQSIKTIDFSAGDDLRNQSVEI